jgi:hypothetical protein
MEENYFNDEDMASMRKDKERASRMMGLTDFDAAAASGRKQDRTRM